MSDDRGRIIRPGGWVALRGRVESVAVRPLAAARSPAAFNEMVFTLQGVRVLTVQPVASPPLAKDGDDLALVGQVKEGSVEPVAWWNFKRSQGYSPRVWEFWPCVAGVGVLLLLVAGRAVLGTLTSLDLLRTSIPLLLLAVLAWSAHHRRRAVRAVEAMRAGQPPGL